MGLVVRACSRIWWRVILVSFLSASTVLVGQSSPSRFVGEVRTSPDHLTLGRQLGAEGKWKEAEKELRIYRNQHPDSLTAIVLHAEALIRVDQPFDAALELQKFLQSHPDAVRAHELYAVLAAGTLKDQILAASELEKCVKLAPKDFQAWKSLGDTYLDQEKSEEAIRAYQRASQLQPADAVTAASLAHAYDQGGIPAKAAAEFDRALKLVRSGGQDAAKDSASVQYLYGQYLLDQGRSEQSVVAMSKALKFNPNSPTALYWRARAYEKMKDYKNAEKDALQAIRLAPHSKEAPLLLINVYRKQENAAKVQEYADMAQKLSDEEQTQASFGRSLRDALDRAEPLLREGRFAEATAQYEALIKLLPTFYEAYFDLGMCYGETGRPAEAEAAFRKYLSFQPVSADGHGALGVLLLQQGRNQEAVSELEQALQIDPTLDEARKALASEYLHESNPNESIRVLRAAKDTKDPQLIVMLASILLDKGDTTGAQREFRRAQAIQPDDPDVLKLKQRLLSKSSTAK